MNTTLAGRAAPATLFASTARAILFTDKAGHSYRAPAGTQVYANERASGGLNIRIPGTLLTQHVNADALLVP